MANSIKQVGKPQARGDNAREARNLKLKPRMAVDVPGTTAPVPSGFSHTQRRLRPGPNDSARVRLLDPWSCARIFWSSLLYFSLSTPLLTFGSPADLFQNASLLSPRALPSPSLSRSRSLAPGQKASRTVRSSCQNGGSVRVTCQETSAAKDVTKAEELPSRFPI